jgi:hypothetical protein
MIDTVFEHVGVNRLDTVRDGKLRMTADELNQLSSGPVHLELMVEVEKKLSRAPRSGGRFRMNLGLAREFIMRD